MRTASLARPVGALVLALGVLAALTPETASGATATLAINEDAPGQPIARLLFRASPGERNALEAVIEPGAVRVSDSLPLTAGPGCGATSDPNTVRCPLAEYGVPPGADVELGDGVDSALLNRGLSGGTVVKGGSGADDIHASGLLLGEAGDDILSGAARTDTLRGASGNDQLFGGPGADRLEPGRGRDIVQSGAGNDRIAARDGEFDRISCGGGHDTVTLDRLDFPGDTCFGSALRRRGAPRASPLEGTLGLSNGLRLDVACPSDFPRACKGTVAAKLDRKLLGRTRFRVARGTHGASVVHPSRRQLRKIRKATRFGLFKGRFTITVRARGRKVTSRVPLNVEERG